MSSVPTSLVDAVPAGASTHLSFKCRAAKDFWFFDTSGSDVGPPDIYAELLSQAKQMISVWDPYACQTAPAARLFDRVEDGVSIRVLTVSSSVGEAKKAMLDNFKAAVLNKNSSVCLDIRYINRAHLVPWISEVDQKSPSL